MKMEKTPVHIHTMPTENVISAGINHVTEDVTSVVEDITNYKNRFIELYAKAFPYNIKYMERVYSIDCRCKLQMLIVSIEKVHKVFKIPLSKEPWVMINKKLNGWSFTKK
jgi:hypothetical protein